MLSDILLALLLVALLIVTRFGYRLINPDVIGRDAAAHLLFAVDIQNNNHRIPDHPSSVATGGVYSYPFLLHWVLSFLSPTSLLAINRWFPAVADTCITLLFLALYLTGTISSTGFLLLFTLFIFTPEFLRPRRADSIGVSARKPGLFLTTASLLSFVAWTNGSDLVFLAFAILFAAFVFLTSKFSLQALTFISIVMAATGQLVVLLLLGGGLILALVISGGVYWRVLWGHVGHLLEYARNQQFKIPNTDPANRLLAFDDFRDVGSIQDLVEAGYHSAIVRPLTNNPYLLGIVGAYLLYIPAGNSLPVDAVYIAWISGGLLAFVLTSLPYLKFLGQADRYLEYVFLPSGILLVQTYHKFNIIFGALILAIILIGLGMLAVSFYFYYTLLYDRETEAAFDDVVQVMGGLESAVVVVQPFWRAREVAWNSGHTVVDFVMNGGSTPAVTAERDRLCPNTYAFVTGEVDWLAEMYDPDWVLFDVGRLGECAPGDLTPPRAAPVFDNGKFTLYRFSDIRGTHSPAHGLIRE